MGAEHGLVHRVFASDSVNRCIREKGTSIVKSTKSEREGEEIDSPPRESHLFGVCLCCVTICRIPELLFVDPPLALSVEECKHRWVC